MLIPKTIGPPGQSYGKHYDFMQMRYSCQLLTIYRALPILVFADIADTDIADIFWTNMTTDIADTDIFVKIFWQDIFTRDVLFFRLLA